MAPKQPFLQGHYICSQYLKWKQVEHSCSISTFIYHQKLKFEISSSTLQISSDRCSYFCTSPDYSLVRQTNVRKLWVLIRTNCICHTFCPLLNKLTISQCVWCFCNQVCYHITSFYIRVQLRCNLKKKNCWEDIFFSSVVCLYKTFLGVHWICSMCLHITTFHLWKWTEFPCKLSTVLYYLSCQRSTLLSIFLLNTLPSSTVFLFWALFSLEIPLEWQKCYWQSLVWKMILETGR